MLNRRDQITMNEQEMWQFIESQKTVRVCTLNKDCTPHLTAMWFAVVEHQIVLVSFSKSQKIVNLERNPDMAVLFEDGIEYKDLRGVSINCKAQLINKHDAVEAMEKAIVLRNQSNLNADEVDKLVKKNSKKKSIIVVTPEKVMTWDHRKLNVNY